LQGASNVDVLGVAVKRTTHHWVFRFPPSAVPTSPLTIVGHKYYLKIYEIAKKKTPQQQQLAVTTTMMTKDDNLTGAADHSRHHQ
jgi:hypothetical protein